MVSARKYREFCKEFCQKGISESEKDQLCEVCWHYDFLSLHNFFNFLSSDGAASHFKNNYTLMNLLYQKKDFGLEAAWTFSATDHGKGPCDRIGAIVKATGTHTTLQGHPNTNFQSALDFWSFTTFDKNGRFQSNESNPIECWFLPKE